MINCIACDHYRPSTYAYAGAAGSPVGFCRIRLPFRMDDHARGRRDPEREGCDLGSPRSIPAPAEGGT